MGFADACTTQGIYRDVYLYIYIYNGGLNGIQWDIPIWIFGKSK